MKFKWLVAAFFASFLGACAVHTPSGSVVVDPHGHHDHGQRHCPPGQAKKGNC